MRCHWSGSAWEAKLKGVSPVVDAVERLAPDLAMDGPNPEYPLASGLAGCRPLFSSHSRFGIN